MGYPARQKAMSCKGCGSVLAHATPDAAGLVIQQIVVRPRSRLTLTCPHCGTRRDWYPPQQIVRYEAGVRA